MNVARPPAMSMADRLRAWLRRSVPRWIAGLSLAILLPASNAAAPVLRSIVQLHHTAWTIQEGVPGPVVAIAQTTDGYLWLGTANGLFRFDGVRFVRFDAIAGEHLPSNAVLTLMATRDGALWVGYFAGGLSVVQGGHVRRSEPAEGLLETGTRRFAMTSRGQAWLANGRGLGTLVDGHWVFMGPADGYPKMGEAASMGVVVDGDDAVWAATSDGVYVRARGQAAFAKVDVPNLGYAELAVAPDGRVWATDPVGERGIRALPRPGAPVDPKDARNGPDAWRPAPQSAMAPAFDRAGRLWYGADSGLMRDATTAAPGAPDRFTPADGLSGDFVMSVFEDREGSMWIGTSDGLDRLRTPKAVQLAFPRHPSVIAMAPGDGGDAWFAARQQGLFHASGGVLQPVPSPLDMWITALYRDRDGVLWAGAFDGVRRVDRTGFTRLPLPAGMGSWQGSVQAIVKDKAGVLWVAASNYGLYRYQGGEWLLRAGRPADFPSTPPNCLAADDAGKVWFGYRGALRVLDGERLATYGPADGLRIGGVQAIEPVGDHVWLGGEFGVQVFDGHGFKSIRAADDALFLGISGIVETSAGELWLNGSGGISRIPAAELRHALADASYRVQVQHFDVLDGLPGSAEQNRPLRTAMQTADGTLWFALSGGVVTIDPAAAPRNAVVPVVEVEQLSAGSRVLRDAPAARARLDPGTHDIAVDYTATSLAMPERVRFRYRLDGLDADWQDAGTRRRAFYTNLGPGHYTFRVTASNEDGVWATQPATMAFDIPPSPLQTAWFRAFCVLVAVVLLWLAWLLRSRQLAARIGDRMQVRMLERERIARDLHDTLLQGFHGLMLRFQAVAEDIPPESPTREQFERVLVRADEILLEGRERVTDLRMPSPELGSLAQTLAGVGRDLSEHHAARFSLTVEADPRPLRPLVHEEVCLIAREALFNAFQHAHATRIELAIVYGPGEFTLRVRDDGAGLPEEIQDGGSRPGHWGIAGMRERARRAGGRFRVWSRPGAGTELELSIPGRAAYADSPREARFARFAWLRGRFRKAG